MAKQYRLEGELGPAVGWNKGYIEKGCYLYGFSHIPLWDLQLPKRTFTFTVFRDPLERAFSHYRMLRGFIENEIDHPCLAVEGPWASQNFQYFMKHAPREHLLNQLYMFSPEFSVDDAITRIRGLTTYGMFPILQPIIDKVNHTFSLNAEVLHTNRSIGKTPYNPTEVSRFRDHFDLEYQLFEKLGLKITGPRTDPR
jgi:hypothetical protein